MDPSLGDRQAVEPLAEICWCKNNPSRDLGHQHTTHTREITCRIRAKEFRRADALTGQRTQCQALAIDQSIGPRFEIRPPS
ncbi:MAG: hypothetical protein QOJ90_2937 [Actinomycetota bacterium]|nr:hypothetical protein [Actinomycetota bacterium]